MKTYLEPPKEVRVYDEADVIVVGGGPAGIGSALSAARNGAKTILIERFGFLGGIQTLCSNAILSFVDPEIHGGIIWEIVQRMEASGKLHEDTYIQKNCHDTNHVLRENGCYFLDLEYYKHLTETMMLESDVKLMYHSLVVGAICEDHCLKGVLVETKEGRIAVMGKTVIDCTGTGDLVWKSGADCFGEEGINLKGRFGFKRSGGAGYVSGFYLCGEDYPKFREYARKNPEWDLWHVGREMFAKAKEEGRLHMSMPYFNINDYPNGRAWVLGSNYPVPEGHYPWEVDMATKAETELRNQAWELVELLRDQVPGFEHVTVEQSQIQGWGIGNHRMSGEYVLCEQDMMGTFWEDSVCVSAQVPDVYMADGQTSYPFDLGVMPHDIPYRCLLSKTYDNLMAAGASGSYELVPWFAMMHCVQSVCAGEAAGAAGALAAKQGITPKQLDVSVLQRTLKAQGICTTIRDLSADCIEKYRIRANTWKPHDN
ncbi:FAD-dependent oxidoreductase [Hominifimenecus sp. rT4P-3]|uniref:FAD-dependent oxidoreductase n=1 Tax=Hominifimenecus sp. rT4P-3 TaxID=3242979 RepID=UPI003DA22A66